MVAAAVAVGHVEYLYQVTQLMQQALAQKVNVQAVFLTV